MRRTGSKGTIGTVAMLGLFLGFALLSLFIVLFGARIYRGVVAGMDNNFALRASLVYVSNRLKSGDAEGGVTIASPAGVDAICLHGEYGTQMVVTYIYYFDGALMEQTALEGVEFLPEAGETIQGISAFSFEPGEGGIELRASAYDGTERALLVKLRSGGIGHE